MRNGAINRKLIVKFWLPWLHLKVQGEQLPGILAKGLILLFRLMFLKLRGRLVVVYHFYGSKDFLKIYGMVPF